MRRMNDRKDEASASNLLVNDALDRGNGLFIAFIHGPLLDALGVDELC